ncbi:MAG: hypothetical protein U1F43_27430 [Myxococcota bacterium]
MLGPRSQPPSARAAVALGALALLFGACRPTVSEDDLLLEQPHATCAIEARELPIDPVAQALLQAEGRALGEVRRRARRPPTTCVGRRATATGCGRPAPRWSWASASCASARWARRSCWRP